MAARPDIEALFHPSGVALLGFVRRDQPPGALLSGLGKRWGDRFHLVDREGGEIDGVPVHRSVADVPDPVELAAINLPRAEVIVAAEECGKRGIANLVVFSKGFGEIGVEGAALEAELLDVCRRYGMRLLGPNTNANSFDRAAPPVHPRVGRVGLVTQSGHLGRIVMEAAPYGLAFSRWIPTGNEADLEIADFIEYFAHDEETAVIATYFEGFNDGAKLRRALGAALEQGKPVVALKVGRGEVASRTASSHTAHLTGSDATFDGLCKQYGVVRVDDLDEQIETVGLYAKVRRTDGGRVALYSISGATCALMADLAEEHGISVPPLAEATQRALSELIPAWHAVANPIDVGPFSTNAPPEQRRRVLDLIASDPNVDVVVLAFTGVITTLTDNFARDVVEFLDSAPKPVVVTWNSWDLNAAAYRVLVDSGVPIFRSFRGCFQALAGFFERARRLESAGPRPGYPDRRPTGGGPTVTLDPATSSALLAGYGIPTAGERFVDSAGAAVAAADALGYPVVMKGHLPEVTHKSDLGLVRVGLANAAEAEAAYADLTALTGRDAAEGGSIQVQQQVAGGVELILGITLDPALGPALLVGLGGVYAEVLRDVSVRPLPITERDAYEMVDELRGRPLLDGVRGGPAVDVEAVVRVMLALARLAWEHPVVELDLNPVIAGPAGVVAVDSVIMVER